MSRYVGIRCPVCGEASPTVDQEVNIRRDDLSSLAICPVCETIVDDDDPCPDAGNLDHLDAEVRSAGFFGFDGCPLVGDDGCNTPWACSERGDCPIVQDES